jgi:nicotinamidase-related amidase
MPVYHERLRVQPGGGAATHVREITAETKLQRDLPYSFKYVVEARRSRKIVGLFWCSISWTPEFQPDGWSTGVDSIYRKTSIKEPTAMSAKSYTKTRFSANDAALVMIDHQSGIMQLVHDYSPVEFRNNVIGLAKLVKVFNLPTVLTTSLGQGPNGTFIPEVVSVFPDVPVIDRPGIISAWDDPEFVVAIEKMGRQDLIMASVTIDVCLPFAAMQAVEAGYNVYGVVDASGALEFTIRENAVGSHPSTGLRLLSSCSGTGGCPPGKTWGRSSTTLSQL